MIKEPLAAEKAASQKPPARIDWINTLFLVVSHLLALIGLIYFCMHFHWLTLALFAVWLFSTSLSITGGYHRLFSHRAYKAHWLVRLYYILFGAASVQNSVANWSADHRLHHKHTDKDSDPYNIRRGFWWAHMGWVCYHDDEKIKLSGVDDLLADPLVRFQHRFYIPLAFLVGWGLPA